MLDDLFLHRRLVRDRHDSEACILQRLALMPILRRDLWPIVVWAVDEDAVTAMPIAFVEEVGLDIHIRGGPTLSQVREIVPVLVDGL